jgi:hypothetical protein
VAGGPHDRGFLPVRPAGAEVLAVDAHGRPALLLRRAGEGSIVLCTYPIEHLTAIGTGGGTDAVSVLYDALAAHAGVRRIITVNDSRVAADVLERDDGSRFAWLVSQADEPVTVKPQLAGALRLATLDGTPAGEAVTLEPFGVGVFQLGNGTGS